MPSLLEIQRGMTATIFGDDAALVALGVVTGGISAAARIDIYRNNVLGNYRKALAARFPVVRRLVGAAFFDAAIDAFVRAHPSNRGDVNRYGGDRQQAEKVYAGVDSPLTAEDVADCISWIASRPSSVNVDLSVVRTRAQVTQYEVHRTEKGSGGS